jgi:type IV pilus assembly protein PilB
MYNFIESLLRQAGLATEAEISKVRERVDQGAGTFMDLLVREARVPEEGIANALVSRLNLPRARVASFLPDEEVLHRVPERLARKLECLPLAIEGRVLVVAMANPGDYRAIQDLEFASALSVRPMVATISEVMDGIDDRYGAGDQIGAFLANVPEADIKIVTEEVVEQPLDVADSLVAAEVAPVVKMCNLILHDAIKANASDVHIEPALHDLQVRMRVDGVLRDYTRVPKWLQNPVVSRLKILAKLDISERRVPQDGRVNVQLEGRSIDLRVSTLPTHFGEKMVLRILGGVSALAVDALGLSPAQQRILESAVEQPQGTILVTGPTGSGKTTTLYALLARHQKSEVNIVTVEDPIEYQLAGVNQVQVNPKAGLTFANALRSILRQDPDVILIGEMRDRDTAEIAVQAAMTGHMVLSTLHTNSAIGAVARMFDLGVDANVLATSLTLAIAQRLVRRICGECREEYEPGEDVRIRVGLSGNAVPVYRGRGCTACGGTGFSGRIGVYEIFRPTNALRKLINDRASEADLRYAARQNGMALLREDALEKVRAGLTSPEEMLRVVQSDESEVPCPGCKALIEAEFATCPYCGLSLKSTCASCGQALRLEWKLCPYCNTDVTARPPAATNEGTVRDEDARDRRQSGAGRREQDADNLESLTDRRRGEPDRRGAPREDPPRSVIRRNETVPLGSLADDWASEADSQMAAEAAEAAMLAAKAAAPIENLVRQAAGDHGEAEVAAPQLSDAAEAPTAPAPVHVPPVTVSAPTGSETPAAGPAVDRIADPEAERRPLRMLVVDDDPDIRMIVGSTLRKLPVPVDIIEAEDGQAAVEKALAVTPDLVVLDVMMPRMDGFDTCRALRGNVRTAFVPILMLTASADQDSRTKGYLIGTDDYMAKPFLPIDLKMRVTRLLRRTYGI